MLICCAAKSATVLDDTDKALLLFRARLETHVKHVSFSLSLHIQRVAEQVNTIALASANE